jgi:hypothetical protein
MDLQFPVARESAPDQHERCLPSPSRRLRGTI